MFTFFTFNKNIVTKETQVYKKQKLQKNKYKESQISTIKKSFCIVNKKIKDFYLFIGLL